MSDIGLTGTVADAAAGGEVTTEPVVSTEPTDTSGGNPAWQGLLNDLPTSLHHLVKPHLDQWDKGVQDQQTKRAEEVQRYTPWNALVEAKYDPTVVHGIMQLMDTDPRRLYDALGSQFGYNVAPEASGQGGADPNVIDLDAGAENPQFDIEKNPQYVEMKKQVDALTEKFKADAEAQQQSVIVKQIETELSALKDKPHFNERAVISIAAANQISLEDAYNEHVKIIEEAMGTRPGNTAPKVMPPGGGHPQATAPKLADLPAKNTRDTVAEMLRLAHTSQG